jgi:hypothetical protein
VTKRGSFVRSNFFSSSSLLRIVPSSYWKARSLFRKKPNLFTTKWCAWWLFYL